MEQDLRLWQKQLQQILIDFPSKLMEQKRQGLLVLRCSTSEVAGKSIKTFGSLEIAKMIYQELLQFIIKRPVSNLAFQCCEHLNRALVVERKSTGTIRV